MRVVPSGSISFRTPLAAWGQGTAVAHVHPQPTVGEFLAAQDGGRTFVVEYRLLVLGHTRPGHVSTVHGPSLRRRLPQAVDVHVATDGICHGLVPSLQESPRVPCPRPLPPPLRGHEDGRTPRPLFQVNPSIATVMPENNPGFPPPCYHLVNFPTRATAPHARTGCRSLIAGCGAWPVGLLYASPCVGTAKAAGVRASAMGRGCAHPNRCGALNVQQALALGLPAGAGPGPRRSAGAPPSREPGRDRHAGESRLNPRPPRPGCGESPARRQARAPRPPPRPGGSHSGAPGIAAGGS